MKRVTFSGKAEEGIMVTCHRQQSQHSGSVTRSAGFRARSAHGEGDVEKFACLSSRTGSTKAASRPFHVTSQTNNDSTCFPLLHQHGPTITTLNTPSPDDAAHINGTFNADHVCLRISLGTSWLALMGPTRPLNARKTST